MMEKITPAEFRSIYCELTSDNSVSDNQNSKEVDDRLKITLKTGSPSVIRDLQIHNGCKSSFEKHWKIVEEKIKELQATAVDDRWHGLTSGFFSIVSRSSLYYLVFFLFLFSFCKNKNEQNSWSHFY